MNLLQVLRIHLNIYTLSTYVALGVEDSALKKETITKALLELDMIVKRLE